MWNLYQKSLYDRKLATIVYDVEGISDFQDIDLVMFNVSNLRKKKGPTY